MFDETGVEWRVVADCDAYLISEYGYCKRTKAAKGARVGRILKPRFYKRCWQYALCKDHQERKYFAHKLVAKAFLGPAPFEGALVCHKDDDPNNNHYSNLYYGTHEENMRDATANGRFRFGENHQRASLTQQQANEIREIYRQGGVSMAALGKRLGVSMKTVQRVVTGKRYISHDGG